MTSLSVLVPVFNEQHLVAASLARLQVLEESPLLERIQVIVVDDCSGDATAQSLQRFREELGLAEVARSTLEGVEVPVERKAGSKIEWLFLRHPANRGKGRALQTALARADCELSVVHDADLEYHPRDLLRMVPVFEEEKADAVFGSRFAGGERRRVLLYRHEIGNRLLTFLTNLVTNLNLTDMETCYKAVRTELLRSIPLFSNDFRIEPEVVIKLAKRDARIFEVPISYSGRTYQEGKKINWRDGWAALWAILRFWLSDRVFTADIYGSQILGRLARAPRFNAWMAEVVRPFCGNRVLEIGSGTGNLTRLLIPRTRYVASDVNPLYLRTLSALVPDHPYLTTQYCDVTDPASFPRLEGGFDTVVCLNVIEHIDDDRKALENIRGVLSPEGRAVILVPQGPWNLGTLDEILGHRRRYDVGSLRRIAAEAGFEVKELIPFNRASSLPWFLSGKILRRRTFSLLQMKAVNLLTPILRRIDRLLPLPPLSLIAVLQPRTRMPADAQAIDMAGEREAPGEHP